MKNYQIIEAVFSNACTRVATVRNIETGETHTLSRYNNGMPYTDINRVVCGYWENRLDLFAFVCEQAQWNCEQCEWIDGATLEILNYWDLCDEETALYEMEA